MVVVMVRSAGVVPRRFLPKILCAVTALAVAATLTGCPKKTKKPGADGGRGEAIGEEGLARGSSLERMRRGLAPEEDGILKDVHFAYDSYELDAAARGVLTANADWLKANGRAKIEVEGHSDERGTVEYNLALGAKRAKAVTDYLATLGVEPGRLATISYGEELPLCREPTEPCWQRNRRAHFVILTQ
jgi:peptidoglycan-associated lipoprotein